MTDKRNTSSLLLTFSNRMKFQNQLDSFLLRLEVIFVSLRSISITLKCCKLKPTEKMKKNKLRKRLSKIHIPSLAAAVNPDKKQIPRNISQVGISICR